MKGNTGFDNEKYLREQTSAIMERVEKFHDKLYLEFGGKLLFDYHASRVLPGFDPNVKMRLLKKLKSAADIILCIYAGDIARKKVRADFGITYDVDALKLIDDLRDWGLDISAVVITRFNGEPAAKVFRNKLERRQIRVCTHYCTKGYPRDIDLIVSKDGYGANEYILTDNPLVIVTGPGPGSGKLGTCLSQLYHEHKAGVKAGYAKFETFPIWNLPLKHPVNVAYEAAAADLGDRNLVDHFHMEAYGKHVVNYNRDIEIFPVVQKILEKITGKSSLYRSPTDMGVNRAGFAITDDNLVQDAARQEVIRRYFMYSCEYAMGFADKATVERAESLMKELNVKPLDRKVVAAARDAAEQARKMQKGKDAICCGAAIELPDGSVVTGKNSPLMHAASSLILNAAKKLAAIPDQIDVLSPYIIQSIGLMKTEVLKSSAVSLDLEEACIALSISAATNPTAQTVMEKLKELRGCDVHLSHIPTPGDEAGLRKLGVNLTSEPNFPTKNLFQP